ncbi:MAG TPA: hypothetical protein VFM46_13465 [Pseudomonadales bacterium]|nr:hypothetical protein [Pseudomonadales bacterium]
MIAKLSPLPLFHTAAAQEYQTTPGKMPAMLQMLRDAIQTGLVEISLPAAQKRYAILFAGGEPVNIYSLQSPVKRIMPNSRLEKLFQGFAPQEEVSLRVLSLTPQTIRMVKIWIEQNIEVPHSTLPTIQIESHLAALKKDGPALIYYRWPSAEALTLLAGHGEPLLHTLFLSGDRVLHSAGSIISLLDWHEPECVFTIMKSNLASQAWDEYILHHTFVLFLGSFIPKIEKLASRVVASAMIRDINFAATAHSWNIYITTSSTTDQTIFPSPEDAAEVYQRLISIAVQRAEAVLGYQTIHGVVREILVKMNSPFRKIFQRHIHIDNHSFPTAELLSATRITTTQHIHH